MSYGPYAGVESDYRRNRIAASFREHRATRRGLFSRRRRSTEPEPAIDWFAA